MYILYDRRSVTVVIHLSTSVRVQRKYNYHKIGNIRRSYLSVH